MRRPEIVKKDDAVRRLFIDDPEWEKVMRNVRALQLMIAAKPERREKILAELLDSTAMESKVESTVAARSA
jgi:hypothetical protein